MLSNAFITGRMCGDECFVRTTRVGGSGVCGSFRGCRLCFGKRDLASSFFPYEFFNAPMALGLSSVDFWLVTSPLWHPIVVTFLIHWMIIGALFLHGKEEVGFLPTDVLSGWCRSLFWFVGKRRRRRRRRRRRVSFQ
jgi:hypothetical protein